MGKQTACFCMRSSHFLWGQEGLKGCEGLAAKGRKVSAPEQGKRGEAMSPHLWPRRGSDSLSPPYGSKYSSWITTGTIKCYRIPIYYSRGWRSEQLAAQHLFCSQSKAPKAPLSPVSPKCSAPRVRQQSWRLASVVPVNTAAGRQATRSCQERAKILWQGFIILKGTNSN